MKTVPICFVPEQTQCLTYREDSVSATLHTKYHYGSGGDAALIVENKYVNFPVESIGHNIRSTQFSSGGIGSQ